MGDPSPFRSSAQPLEKGSFPPRHGGTVRVLVVDDSVIARAVYSRLISDQTDFALIGQCSNAEQALAMPQTSSADVIILDLQMPGMGGLHALPKLMALAPAAKVLVVSCLTGEGGEQTVAALALGAADTLPKPEAGRFDTDYRQRLIEAIRALGQRALRRRATAQQPPAWRRPSSKTPRVLAIGASTGGILALRQFFECLPARIGMPIIITQHLPASFMPAFADQVARVSMRPATLARTGSVLEPDAILIAPGDAHLVVEGVGGSLVVQLGRQRSASGCMPSVDPMLSSLAQATDGHCLAVILTGMGRDGTVGARELVESGGTVIVQDEPTSAVWGMPGSIANAGLASAILPPQQLAARVPVARTPA